MPNLVDGECSENALRATDFGFQTTIARRKFGKSQCLSREVASGLLVIAARGRYWQTRTCGFLTLDRWWRPRGPAWHMA